MLVLICFFSSYADHRDLHSFPTRRSSDLDRSSRPHRSASTDRKTTETIVNLRRQRMTMRRIAAFAGVSLSTVARVRSEEHTSELQSHVNLVCRLLLEKKKKKQLNTDPQKH